MLELRLDQHGIPVVPEDVARRVRAGERPQAEIMTGKGWARNAMRHGVAGLNVEAGRVPTSDSIHVSSFPRRSDVHYGAVNPMRSPTPESGRYPSNLALDPEAAEELGRQSGELSSGGGEKSVKASGGRGEVVMAGGTRMPTFTHFEPNTGTGARFFHSFKYNPKAGPEERLRGCENHFWRVDRDHPLGFVRISQAEYLAMGHLPGCRKAPRGTYRLNNVPGVTGTMNADNAIYGQSITATRCAPGCQERQRYQGSIHPCLKPLELCRYLAKLILPPPRDTPRRLLVPFSGTGSEVIGALLAGWDEVVAIEDEPVYCDLAAARIAAWGPYSAGRANAIAEAGGIKAEPVDVAQGMLW